MPRANVYVDLDGNEISLLHLDDDEQKLLARVRRRARTNTDWNAFENYWTAAVPAFYEARAAWPGRPYRTRSPGGSPRTSAAGSPWAPAWPGSETR
jgi:hypothetical protein